MYSFDSVTNISDDVPPDITPGQRRDESSLDDRRSTCSDVSMVFPDPDITDMDQEHDTGGKWHFPGNRKRVRSEDSGTSSDTVCVTKKAINSLTVIFGPMDVEKKLTSLNSLRVTEALEKISPECVLQVRYNERMNLIAVDARNGHAAQSLGTIKELCGIPVRSYTPPSGQTSTGVIRDVDVDVTQEELDQHLRSDVKIATIRRLGRSRTVKVVFHGNTLPSHVFLGYVRHPVGDFKNKPLQCHNCGGFGHKKIACRRTRACGRCAENHDASTAECHSSTLKCVNCGGSHEATAHVCPKWQQQQTIVSYSKKTSVGFREARSAVAKNETKNATESEVKRSEPGVTTKDVSFVSVLEGAIPKKKTAHSTSQLTTRPARKDTHTPGTSIHQPPLRKEASQPARVRQDTASQEGNINGSDTSKEPLTGWRSIVKAAVKVSFAILAKFEAPWAHTISTFLKTMLVFLQVC